MQFFERIIPADESAIVSRVSGQASREIAAWLTSLHEPLVRVEQADRKPFCVLTIGDCLMGAIQSFLMAGGHEKDLDFDFRYYYFSAQQGADIDQDGIAAAIRGGVDSIAASYLSYEGTPLYRSLMASRGTSAEEVDQTIQGIAGFIHSHLSQIRALTTVPILLHNVSGLPLGRWRSRLPIAPHSRAQVRILEKLNAAVEEVARNIENCIVVDEVAIGKRTGLRRASRPLFRAKEFRRAEFHPIEFERQVAKDYLNILSDVSRFKKTKVLALDFDNTLWKGVMADETVAHYVDRQEMLRRLSEQGILLVAVSKNDEKNIRWDEMSLKPDDFVAKRINWNLKSQSIKEIAEELNLGLDSFVFIDDNPAERQIVSQEIPSIVVLDADSSETWQSLAQLFQMPNTQDTEEARSRKLLYRQQADRKASLTGGADYPALMRGLKLKADIRLARPAEIDRIVELAQRTNQFNTTTIRYQRSEIETLVRGDGGHILIGDLSDKFGTLGLVCVVVVRTEGQVALIENFVMSCRAMGFGLERAMLAFTKKRWAEKQLTALFRPSAKNEPASALYPGAGFEKVADDRWALPQASSLELPDWIAVESR